MQTYKDTISYFLRFCKQSLHHIFKENKALIASKPYYDCVGLMEK